ncbi:DUF2075 domain-containing protein [Egicoccus halophilus]|uniref:ATP-binding protein n=1 Tax=Egicoccus halophilus TaxID=1670830 RepID=A0A8J3AB05_9ACTN|nr:DUF2075 domain-containing protein [Egicoccus halophilus]GGI09389.1 ATP-binding protein [Egicoccus halophilus]
MAELYWGTTSDFVEQATQNTIAETLRQAFFDQLGFEPSPSELRSWRNSLKALANAVRYGGFLDHGIFLEFQLPMSSRRIDALITGHDHQGRPGAVLVELKQWDHAELSDVPDCVGVMYGGRLRDQLHPSAQAGQYREYLADTHTAFHDAAVTLGACSFLHDLPYDDRSELYDRRYAHLLGIYPLFAGDRLDELITFLDDRLGGGNGLGVLRTVREGRYRPHRKLLEHTAEMIKQEPSYVLLDEQQVVLKSILSAVDQAVSLDQKTVFIVRGGPGTGKSVLALNLVAELSAAGYATHHATGSSAFTQTVRKLVGTRAAKQFNYFNSYLNAEENELDVLICDEAHRIREYSWNRWTKKKADDPDRPQIDEILSVARVSVFFIDDLQAVRRNEIGDSGWIETLAERRGAEVREHQLEIQFRCGGSDGYVRWLENTLGIRRTANALWSGDPNFEFDIVDSPQELDALVRSRAEQGHSARLVAGYCWSWSKPTGEGELPADVQIDGWSRPWNARPDAGRLAAGIPKSHLWASEPGGLEQVGCIYTAQGFEFDYVGVIFGDDLVYRPREGWVGRSEFSKDSGLKRGLDAEEFTALVKNTYRVLLSRGLKGCYVYFTDEKTRDFFESRIDIAAIALAAERAAGYRADAP